MDWPKLTELVDQLKSGKRKPSELVKQCLNAISKAKDFNAVIEVNPKALERAKAVEKTGKKGKLYGVPYLAKDNFLTREGHTTAASNILKPFKAPYQATAIEKLEAEGAILLGKTNLDAFAHGSSTENSDFGPTKNPHDKTRVPGGSSGGSAAAVALGLCSFAIGTDTGGSIRLPASFSGAVGLKPTYGLISRYGVVAMASSTDVIGPLTRSVEDAAYVLDVMAGKDEYDATTIERAPRYQLKPQLRGLKIGMVKEHLAGGVDPQVKAAVEATVAKAKAAGAQVSEVSIPVDELALAVYYIVVPAEISSNLARYDGIKYGLSEKSSELQSLYEKTRAQGFNDENTRRILIGTYVLSSGYYDAYYKQAQAVRTKLIEEYNKAFDKVDLLIGPVSPTPAFKLGAHKDPLQMYLTDVMTVGANLTGIPAISLPVAKTGGLPIGLHLMAPQREENRLFNAAAAIEELVASDE